MIARALKLISDFLNKEIKATYGIDEDCVLVSGLVNPENYMDGLDMLSTIIGLLHTNPCISIQNHPDMPGTLDKLTFEIPNTSINQLSNIWSGLGSIYVPSIIYKVKTITIG